MALLAQKERKAIVRCSTIGEGLIDGHGRVVCSSHCYSWRICIHVCPDILSMVVTPFVFWAVIDFNQTNGWWAFRFLQLYETASNFILRHPHPTSETLYIIPL